MRARRFLMSFAIAFAAWPVAAAETLRVGQFRAVELRNGGHVIVRHGAVQRVSIISGDSQTTRVHVDANKRLVVDNSGRKHARDARVQIEVITPDLDAVAVSNGGTLQAAGAFPARASIAAAVAQGGLIDIRSIEADAVNAAISSGGRIFTNVGRTLHAAIDSGGGITYWGGDIDVETSVQHGGVVMRGTSADLRKPLAELGPAIQAIAPVPPVAGVPAIPAIPPIRD